METISRYGKMIIILLTLVIVTGLCFALYSTQQVRASEASSYGRDGEVVAYAAAMASLAENTNKNKSEMLEKAQAFIDARDALIAECDANLAANSDKIGVAEKAYEELAAASGKSYLTLEEYETQMTDENKAMIAERNAYLERTDSQIYELEQKNHIDDLPVLYFSLEELKGGLEESITILEDFRHMYDDGNEPETKGYTREDFYRLCDERIAAEKAVLEKLSTDSNPDLYTYSLMLYQTRADHKVIT